MARERAGFKSAAAFASAKGLTESTYRSAENGTRGLSISAARQYARLLNVTWQWLVDGGPPVEGGDISDPVTTQPINIMQLARDLPILGAGGCGDDGLFELNGQVADHTRRPPRLVGVKDAYGLWVNGSSMDPWRKNGAFVWVHPHWPVNIGDHIVVQLKPAREGDLIPAYIKKLVRRTARELTLHQYQPAENIAIPMSKVMTIHRVVEWEEAFGM